MSDSYTFAENVTASRPQPGDIFAVVPTSQVFRWIELGEKIIDYRLIRKRKAADLPVYGHAGIATRYVRGQLYIAQAEPHGAEEVPWNRHAGNPHIWSTGTLPPCPPAAAAALRYCGFNKNKAGYWSKSRPGVPYSFLDYLAIALRAQHIPAPHLRAYIASTGHMICSQLAAAARLEGGAPLFPEWTGYVTPLDIGLLCEGITADQ